MHTYTSKQKPYSKGYYTIAPPKLQRPASGDKFECLLRVFLPNDAQTNQMLRDDLQFGERCKVLGQSLYLEWGDWISSEYRFESMRCVATTAQNAFALAQQTAEKDLEKLEKMLQKRLNLSIQTKD